MQNVGAYGTEVAETITRLRVYDRATGAVEDWDPARCGFGFRTSALKHTDRYVVLAVTFALPARRTRRPSATSRWPAVSASSPASSRRPTEVRETVLELRRSKGMLLDADDHDTWSVGSFFVNPFVAPEQVPDGCPHFVVDGRIKLSAGMVDRERRLRQGLRDEPGCASRPSTRSR